MGAIAVTLRSLPHTQYRKNPYFYLWYDGIYAVLCGLAIAAMRARGIGNLAGAYSARWWLLLPVVLYGGFICHVFIHNASHGNFPRAINRVVGEVLGVLVLTRFASWEVIHQRHHQFTDDTERDPHPAERSYWRFLVRSIINVEAQLSKTYLDTFGDTPENRRIEKVRSVVSAVTGVLLLGAWYVLLGAQAFWFFLIPTTVGSLMFVTHFNWCTHNATSGTDEYYPVDLDHGYYWIGNRMFFGIYYHKIHHERARLFNPMLARKGPPPPVEQQRPKRRSAPPPPIQVDTAA